MRLPHPALLAAAALATGLAACAADGGDPGTAASAAASEGPV